MDDIFGAPNETELQTSSNQKGSTSVSQLLQTESSTAKRKENPGADNKDSPSLEDTRDNLKRVKTKHEEDIEAQEKGTKISVGVGQERGGRHYMEDVCVLQEDARVDKSIPDRLSYFAVIDGHGGKSCADWISKNLLNYLELKQIQENCSIRNLKRLLLEGFKRADEDLLKLCKEKDWKDGCTCVCVLIIKQQVCVAHLGDAKCMLARISDKEGEVKGYVLTKPHKPVYKEERSKIEKSGGYIDKDGRLMGRLEVSRAFGDLQFKKNGLSSTPDVQVFPLSEKDVFLMLGSDGFWGAFGNEAVEEAHKLLKEGMDVNKISKKLVQTAIDDRGCKDNCSLVFIKFQRD